MDRERFDGLARTLAGVNTRRGVLGLAAAIPIVGGVFAHFDLDDAEAKGRRRHAKHRHHAGQQRDVAAARKRKKKKKKCKSESPATTCAGKCGPVTNTCGQTIQCGTCHCAADCEVCCNGVCCSGADARCHPQTKACCVPESATKTCAGTCGNVVNNCGVSVTCNPCPCGGGCGEHGTCQVAGGFCNCDPGYGTCSISPCDTHLANDPDNCGFCGTVCLSGLCENGQCACPNNLAMCDGKCYDLKNDSTNCGNCGKVCSSGACKDGACACGGLVDCNGECRAIQNDPTNCGACGNVCPGNGPHGQATCSNFTCGLNCASGYSPCNGACVDLTSTEHCGACGNACQGNATCTGGQCVEVCVPKTCGPADCGEVSDGCDGTITCSNLGCTCPAGGTLCDQQGDIADWKFCNGDSCLCAGRADGQGNTCYNPSAGAQCGSGTPICQTDSDCIPFTGAQGRCIKAGSCGTCFETACVAAC